MEADTSSGLPPAVDADLCHAMARDLFQEGKAAEAETFYRAALSLAPGRPDSWTALGLAILTQGRAGEAVPCVRESLRLDPANPETHNMLGRRPKTTASNRHSR